MDEYLGVPAIPEVQAKEEKAMSAARKLGDKMKEQMDKSPKFTSSTLLVSMAELGILFKGFLAVSILLKMLVPLWKKLNTMLIFLLQGLILK